MSVGDVNPHPEYHLAQAVGDGMTAGRPLRGGADPGGRNGVVSLVTGILEWEPGGRISPQSIGRLSVFTVTAQAVCSGVVLQFAPA